MLLEAVPIYPIAVKLLVKTLVKLGRAFVFHLEVRGLQKYTR